MWGSKSTYVTDDPLPVMKGSLTPQYMRVCHDVMVTLPYARMEPHNECVTPANVALDGDPWRTNFALAKAGEVYLVYSLHGGSGTVDLAPGHYSAVRIDPRDGTRTELGTVAGGTVGFSLPPGDWVLVYRRTTVGAGPRACPEVRATTGSGSQTHNSAFGVPVAPTTPVPWSLRPYG